MYSQISLCSYTPSTVMETDNEAKLLNQDSIQSDRFKRSCEKLHCFLWNSVHIQREHCWRVDSLLHPRKKNEITKGPIVQFSREQTRFPKAQQENQKLGHHDITTKKRSLMWIKRRPGGLKATIHIKQSWARREDKKSNLVRSIFWQA